MSTSLKKAYDDKQFDKRLQDKHLSEGKMVQADLDNSLNNLEDDSKNMTTTKDYWEKRTGQVQAPQESQTPSEQPGSGQGF